MMRITPNALLAAALGLGLPVSTGAGAATAGTGDRHVVKTITTKAVMPLQFAVQGKHVYVADSSPSTAHRGGPRDAIAHGGAVSDGGDLAGVAVAGASIAYVWSSGDYSVTKLEVLRSGKHVLSVDLAAFERKHNPDGHVVYGLQKPASATCENQIGSASAFSESPGRLYRSQHAGAMHLVASAFHGAAGLAVSSGGRFFVAELFAGRIAVVSHRLDRVATLPNAFGLEWSNGRLFAPTMGPTASWPTNAAASVVQLG